MELFVDTADLDVIREIEEYFPVDGFTTNPKILASSTRPVTELMKEYKAYVETKNCKVFFQVTAGKSEEMLWQAEALQAYFGEHLVVKLPAVKEGYRAVKLCKAAGIAVCVTVVHSAMQGILAAKAGADYVAPYVSHIDNMGADGIYCVEEMVTAFAHAGYPCKVLGASFRTVDQIKRLAVAGCQSVTIAPALFDAMIAHPATDASMAGFDKIWTETFGEQGISDLLPDSIL